MYPRDYLQAELDYRAARIRERRRGRKRQPRTACRADAGRRRQASDRAG